MIGTPILKSQLKYNRLPWIMVLPLEKLEFSIVGPDNKTITKSALDTYWVEDCRYPRYYPLSKLDLSSQQEWLENSNELVEVLDWLLSLPQHKFWSQLVFGDPGWRDMAESYLTDCPRPFDTVTFTIAFGQSCSKVAEVMAVLHRTFLNFYWRLGSAKESETAYMTAEFYVKFVRQNGIFDLMVMLDLSAIYGPKNQQSLASFFSTLIHLQPKYLEDLKTLSKGVLQRLDDVELQLRKWTSRKNRREKPSESEIEEFRDLIVYLVDVTYTLNCFMDCCSPAKEVFYDLHVMARLPTIHESLVVPLKRELTNFSLGELEEFSLKKSLGQLGYISDGLARLFRKIFEFNIFNCLIKEQERREKQQMDQSELVAEFVHTMTNLVSDPEFLLVYDNLFPFELDCSKLISADVEIDCEQLSYIGDGIGRVKMQSTPITVPNVKTSQEARPKDKSSHKFSEPTVKSKTQEEIDTLVRQITDVLPDFDRSVIEAVLSRFAFDTERALNALLTDTYDTSPTGLSDLAAGIAGSSASEPEVPSTAENAEFQRLMESQKRGTNRVLEKKPDAVDRQFYDRFQLETANSDEEDSEVPWDERLQPNLNHCEFDYEDEYDDTYDSHNVGAADAEDHDDQQMDPRPTQKIETDSSTEGRSKGENFYNSIKSQNRPPIKEENSAGGYTGGYHRAQKDRNRAAVAHHNRKELSTKKFAKGFGANPAR